jgi:hypothetical protein
VEETQLMPFPWSCICWVRGRRKNTHMRACHALSGAGCRRTTYDFLLQFCFNAYSRVLILKGSSTSLSLSGVAFFRNKLGFLLYINTYECYHRKTQRQPTRLISHLLVYCTSACDTSSWLSTVDVYWKMGYNTEHWRRLLYLIVAK